MKTVEVNIKNGQVELDCSPLATGNVGTVFFDFTFSENWDGYSKTAVFYKDPNTKYLVLINNNSCTVPAECLVNKGPMYFGVFGNRGNSRISSVIKQINIVEGAYGTGVSPGTPTPEIYAQILDAMETCVDETDATLDEIEELMATIEASEASRNATVAEALVAATSAQGSASSSASSASAAASSASSAASSAGAAASSASSATASATEAISVAAGKQDKWSGRTVTISVSDWAGGTTCTKQVAGVTAACLVIVEPSIAGVECTSQGNGSLTFTANSTPAESVTVKAVIFA